jgi:transposase InsO family protein
VHTRNPGRGRRGDREAARSAGGGRPRCRRGDDRLPPRPAHGPRSLQSDDLEDPQARGADHATAAEARPRSSLIRFEADLPNETWQTDITHWRLAAGEHVEILNLIDDHSRLFLASEAYPTIKAQDIVDSFHKTVSLHGLPASLLTDNGAVFTATSRRGKVLLQSELQRLGIASKNSPPYHPQTYGKVERLHQTLKASGRGRCSPRLSQNRT